MKLRPSINSVRTSLILDLGKFSVRLITRFSMGHGIVRFLTRMWNKSQPNYRTECCEEELEASEYLLCNSMLLESS